MELILYKIGRDTLFGYCWPEYSRANKKMENIPIDLFHYLSIV